MTSSNNKIRNSFEKTVKWIRIKYDQSIKTEGFKEMGKAPWVLIKKGMIVLCYDDDLITFAEKPSSINGLKTEMSKMFKVKGLGKPVQFFSSELDWSLARAVTLQQTTFIWKILWLLEWATLSLPEALLIQVFCTGTSRGLPHCLPRNMNAIAELSEVYHIWP